jgi:hypothetical protein
MRQFALLTALGHCGIMSIKFACIRWENYIRAVELQEDIKTKDEIIKRQ